MSVRCPPTNSGDVFVLPGGARERARAGGPPAGSLLQRQVHGGTMSKLAQSSATARRRVAKLGEGPSQIKSDAI